MQKVHKFLPFRVIGLEKIEVMVPLVTDHLHKQRKLTIQLISNSFSHKSQDFCQCITVREEKVELLHLQNFKWNNFSVNITLE
jgi:hypothetical protein